MNPVWEKTTHSKLWRENKLPPIEALRKRLCPHDVTGEINQKHSPLLVTLSYDDFIFRMKMWEFKPSCSHLWPRFSSTGIMFVKVKLLWRWSEITASKLKATKPWTCHENVSPTPTWNCAYFSCYPLSVRALWVSQMQLSCWGSSTLGQVDSEGDDAFYSWWGAHESIRRPHRGWWKVPAWTLFLLSSLSLPDLHPWGPIHYWGGSWVFHFSMSWTNPFLVYFFEFWVML